MFHVSSLFCILKGKGDAIDLTTGRRGGRRDVAMRQRKNAGEGRKVASGQRLRGRGRLLGRGVRGVVGGGQSNVPVEKIAKEKFSCLTSSHWWTFGLVLR